MIQSLNIHRYAHARPLFFRPCFAMMRSKYSALFPPVLCDDAVEVLGPRRPAFDPPWMLVTVLVAQHGGHIVDDSTKAAWEASRNECSMNETPTKAA